MSLLRLTCLFGALLLSTQHAAIALSPGDLLDPEDQSPDVSPVLDNPWGFLPLALPITEPAVGIGVVAAPLFIRAHGANDEGKPLRPDMFGGGGLITDNKTKGLFAFHSGNFLDHRLRTTSALFDTAINLDFYSVGGDPSEDEGRGYTIEASGLTVGGMYQLGKSDWWAGSSFIYSNTRAIRRTGRPIDEIDDVEPTQLGIINVKFQYSTLNNFFTPTAGHDWSFESDIASLYGSDDVWQKYKISGVNYWQLDSESNWVFGLKAQGAYAMNEPPFYLNPFVQLRGVPAMRYQGEIVADAEFELRYQILNRWSILGFGGVGFTWNDTSSGQVYRQDVIAGGLGFRYLLARKYGMHAGLDFGVSDRSGTAVYIQFGTAWLRF